MIYRIPVEVKSFFFNILNDNELGHTATVASILKQGSSFREDVAQVYDLPENIAAPSKQGLINHILSKSRAEAKITKVCCFNKISVNGKPIKVGASFCLYVREEISKNNIHCGRQKLHYPPTLVYSDSDIEIDNRKVVKSVSETLSNYAFLVEAFEYDSQTGVFNIDAIIVGRSGIPYSKVFINQKGSGNKFTKVFSENNEDYDSEIISMRKHLGFANVGPENFYDIMDDVRAKALQIIKKELMKLGAVNIRILRDEYPYAIYDIEYKIDSVKHYAMVRYTTTEIKRFLLSSDKISFLNRFAECTALYLITDVLEKKNVFRYTNDEICEMNKFIRTIIFDASEGAE